MGGKNQGQREIELIALGASIGGIDALERILTALPPDFPCVAVVQHIYPGFIGAYVARINKGAHMEALVAKDGAPLQRGRIYFADDGRQFRLSPSDIGYCFRYGETEKQSLHCPAVDVLFSSIAACDMARRSIGVILTGMGRDGAKGLLEMRQSGACTIGQDERTSVVYGMPRMAYEIGAVQHQLPLERISCELIDCVNKRKGAAH